MDTKDVRVKALMGTTAALNVAGKTSTAALTFTAMIAQNLFRGSMNEMMGMATSM